VAAEPCAQASRFANGGARCQCGHSAMAFAGGRSMTYVNGLRGHEHLPGTQPGRRDFGGAAAWPASTRPSTELNSPAYTLRMR
jgi:hypothetical protein